VGQGVDWWNGVVMTTNQEKRVTVRYLFTHYHSALLIRFKLRLPPSFPFPVPLPT
jgi:hypothetical protein